MAKTALITGASAGLGRDLCDLFAADGHDLIIVARREGRLREIADELSDEHGVDVRVEPADLSDPDAPERMFANLEAEDLQVDFLVNNAGFGSNGKFWELERERELSQVQVNVSALVNLTHLALQGMVDRGFGRILNVASTAGFQPGPYMSIYYATKAFVISFSEGIAHELKDTGVTVTVHCPGAFDSEFAEKAGNDETPLFQMQNVPPSEAVAAHAYAAMHAGKVITVHGAMNTVGSVLAQISPRGIVRTVAAKTNETPDLS